MSFKTFFTENRDYTYDIVKAHLRRVLKNKALVIYTDEDAQRSKTFSIIEDTIKVYYILDDDKKSAGIYYELV